MDKISGHILFNVQRVCTVHVTSAIISGGKIQWPWYFLLAHAAWAPDKPYDRQITHLRICSRGMSSRHANIFLFLFHLVKGPSSNAGTEASHVDRGMRRLEGHSDDRPVVGVYAMSCAFGARLCNIHMHITPCNLRIYLSARSLSFTLWVHATLLPFLLHSFPSFLHSTFRHYVARQSYDPTIIPVTFRN